MLDILKSIEYGKVRGAADNMAEGDGRVAVNNRGDVMVAESLLYKSELTRQGNSYSCQIATGSAYTNVANMPTTRAELALYNGEPSSGLSYIIDQVWMLSLTSITAISSVTLLAQIVAAAALADDTTQLINGLSGKVYGGRGKRAVAVTTMIANKWQALAVAGAQSAASIGSGVFAEVNGGLILPPGYTLGLNAVVGTATGTSLIGVSWHEVQLPLR